MPKGLKVSLPIESSQHKSHVKYLIVKSYHAMQCPKTQRQKILYEFGSLFPCYYENPA